MTGLERRLMTRPKLTVFYMLGRNHMIHPVTLFIVNKQVVGMSRGRITAPTASALSVPSYLHDGGLGQSWFHATTGQWLEAGLEANLG